MSFKKFLEESYTLDEAVKVDKYNIAKLLSKGITISSYQRNRKGFRLTEFNDNGKLLFVKGDSIPIMISNIDRNIGLAISTFNDKIDVHVFDMSMGKPVYINSKLFTINAFFKDCGEYVKKPLSINGKPLNKFSHFEKNGRHLYFVMKDGDKSYKLFNSGRDSDIILKYDIEQYINDLETMHGIKITKTALSTLETLYPELYTKQKFEMSNKILSDLVDSIKKHDELVAQYFLKTNLKDRMIRGIEIKEDKLTVYGWVDNTSSGYRSKTVKIDKKINTVAALTKFILQSELIQFIHDIVRESDSYFSGFAQWIKDTGGHKGNHVYMD